MDLAVVAATTAVWGFVLVVIVFTFAIPIHQRHQARRYIQQAGGQILTIRWRPFIDSLEDPSTRRWNVKYRCRCGTVESGVLQTRLWAELQWHKGPSHWHT